MIKIIKIRPNECSNLCYMRITVVLLSRTRTVRTKTTFVEQYSYSKTECSEVGRSAALSSQNQFH